MGPSAIDIAPDLGDFDCVGIRYVAISRILGAEPKWLSGKIGKKESSKPFSDSTSASLVVDLGRLRTW